MARSYVEQLRMVHYPQRRQQVIVVRKRLALPHYHDVRHASTEIVLHNKQLVDNLTWDKIPHKAIAPCCAERAPHGASRLARAANGQSPIFRRQTNGFHDDAIMKPEKVLARAIN